MDHKCVIVLKQGLPAGFAANAAAVLAVSLGRKYPEIVAEDLADASGNLHAGLINVPLPILQASEDQLKKLHEQVSADSTIGVIGFSEPARVARTFENYRTLLAQTENRDLQYVGLALLGPKSRVTPLTAGLPLLK